MAVDPTKIQPVQPPQNNFLAALLQAQKKQSRPFAGIFPQAQQATPTLAPPSVLADIKRPGPTKSVTPTQAAPPPQQGTAAVTPPPADPDGTQAVQDAIRARDAYQPYEPQTPQFQSPGAAPKAPTTSPIVAGLTLLAAALAGRHNPGLARGIMRGSEANTAADQAKYKQQTEDYDRRYREAGDTYTRAFDSERQREAADAVRERELDRHVEDAEKFQNNLSQQRQREAQVKVAQQRADSYAQSVIERGLNDKARLAAQAAHWADTIGFQNKKLSVETAEHYELQRMRDAASLTRAQISADTALTISSQRQNLAYGLEALRERAASKNLGERLQIQAAIATTGKTLSAYDALLKAAQNPLATPDVKARAQALLAPTVGPDGKPGPSAYDAAVTALSRIGFSVPVQDDVTQAAAIRADVGGTADPYANPYAVPGAGYGGGAPIVQNFFGGAGGPGGGAPGQSSQYGPGGQPGANAGPSGPIPASTPVPPLPPAVHGAIRAAAGSAGVDPRLIYADFGSESSFGQANQGDPFAQFGLIGKTPGHWNPDDYAAFGYRPKANTLPEAAKVDAAIWAHTKREMQKAGMATDLPAMVAYQARFFSPIGAPNDPQNLNANKVPVMLSILAGQGVAAPGMAAQPGQAQQPTQQQPTQKTNPPPPPPAPNAQQVAQSIGQLYDKYHAGETFDAAWGAMSSVMRQQHVPEPTIKIAEQALRQHVAQVDQQRQAQQQQQALQARIDALHQANPSIPLPRITQIAQSQMQSQGQHQAPLPEAPKPAQQSGQPVLFAKKLFDRFKQGNNGQIPPGAMQQVVQALQAQLQLSPPVAAGIAAAAAKMP